MTKRKFLFQGAVLTAVSLFLRITNMGYRSFLSQEMGSAGMGLYQLIFSVFLLTVTLSTSESVWPSPAWFPPPSPPKNGRSSALQ